MKLLRNSKIYSAMIFFSLVGSGTCIYSMEADKGEGDAPQQEVSPKALEAGIAAIKLEEGRKTDSGIELACDPIRIRRTFDLRQFYNEETKTLDLSRIPLVH